MRTVDPEKWSRTLRKVRPVMFGDDTPARFEIRLRQSFRDAMADFWKNSSVAGVKFVIDKKSSVLKRYVWLVLLLVITVWGVAVSSYNIVQFHSRPPLLVSLQSTQFPIQNVVFPAVAICSYNVISKKALAQYTEYLISKDTKNTYTAKQIKRNLLSFGALLTVTLPPKHIDELFTDFLMEVDPKYNVTEIMFKLSPRCEELLFRCSWRGRNTPCERLFQARVTPNGFCCAFNSRYQSSDVYNKPKFLDFVGQDEGLTVLITENSDDFAHIRRPLTGVEVLIFDGNEYPLAEAGVVRSYPVKRNASVFLRVSARTQYIAGGLKFFSESWRNCRIGRSEGPKSWRSSHAWCLTECRREVAASLCGCVPFTMLPRDRDLQCQPKHFDCLSKHREKFLYYYPGEHSDPNLMEEQQDGLDCTHCMPDCAKTVYSAALADSTYLYPKKIFKNLYSKGASLRNASVIRVFYSSEDQHLYAVEANLRWYESCALLGGQWVLLTGVTVISLMELFYHCTIRWAHHYLRRTRACSKRQ